MQGGAACDLSPRAPSPAWRGTWHLAKPRDRTWEHPADQRDVSDAGSQPCLMGLTPKGSLSPISSFVLLGSGTSTVSGE